MGTGLPVKVKITFADGSVEIFKSHGAAAYAIQMAVPQLSIYTNREDGLIKLGKRKGMKIERIED